MKPRVHLEKAQEVARYGEFNYQVGLSKKGGFSMKERSDIAQVQNQVISGMEHYSAQKLHLLFVTLLPIFDFFFVFFLFFSLVARVLLLMFW